MQQLGGRNGGKFPGPLADARHAGQAEPLQQLRLGRRVPLVLVGTKLDIEEGITPQQLVPGAGELLPAQKAQYILGCVGA